MQPAKGAGNRFTNNSIVPHLHGFRKVVAKVLRQKPADGRTAFVSAQKPPAKSRLFLYDIDELYDFPVPELAIPIKLV